MRIGFLLALLGHAVACGGDDEMPASNAGGGDGDMNAPGDGDMSAPGDGDMSGPAAEYAYSACAFAEHVGGFTASLVQPEGGQAYARVEGKVNDGVVPDTIPNVLMTMGDCSLVEGNFLSDRCDPACSFDESCTEAGECIPLPSGQDMGTVTITGLKDGDITFMARAPKNNYTATGTLSYPNFDEGVTLTLSGTGATGPALSLVAEGVAPLVVNEPTVSVAMGEATTVTWNAPATAGHSRMLATLNISLHGGDPVRIECDTDDDGSLEIPEPLITALLGYNFSGFPAISLTRQSSDSVDGPHGCIDFRALSTIDRHPVEIAGLTSCNEAMDTCPAGQSCNLETLSCE